MKHRKVHLANNEYGRTRCGKWVIPGTRHHIDPTGHKLEWTSIAGKWVTCKICYKRRFL